MDLTVIVVSWNTRALLQRCLESVSEAIPDLHYEVVVVDNNSTDASAEMVEASFPSVRLIRSPRNVGFARANNLAIRVSTGRHVLLLNSDACLVGRAAQELVSYLDEHPKVGIVGGKVLNPDGSFQSSYADFPRLTDEILVLTGLARWWLPRTFPSYPEDQSRDVRAVDWMSGAFLAARRQAIDEVGLLDEAFFMYSEEMEWCYRMKLAGWEVVYLPRAEATHWAGSSARRVPDAKRARLYRSKLRFFRKHYGPVRTAILSSLLRTSSVAKLFTWYLYGLLAVRGARDRAKHNVISYRTLLADLGTATTDGH